MPENVTVSLAAASISIYSDSCASFDGLSHGTLLKFIHAFVLYRIYYYNALLYGANYQVFALLVYKCLHGTGPSYLSEYCAPLSAFKQHHDLRSIKWSDLYQPRTIGLVIMVLRCCLLWPYEFISGIELSYVIDLILYTILIDILLRSLKHSLHWWHQVSSWYQNTWPGKYAKWHRHCCQEELGS